MSHTPGPWMTVPHNFISLGGDERGMRIVFPVDRKDGPVMDIAYVPVQSRDDDGTDNARLIAAAPELLAALKKLRRSDLPECEEPLWTEIKAAIAKAEGTSV